ncbi:hypothetical protein EON67_01620 [archaeon]|nr:MAG: hypothetical protein EON67_01620 [archaeon]
MYSLRNLPPRNRCAQRGNPASQCRLCVATVPRSHTQRHGTQALLVRAQQAVRVTLLRAYVVPPASVHIERSKSASCRAVRGLWRPDRPPRRRPVFSRCIRVRDAWRTTCGVVRASRFAGNICILAHVDHGKTTYVAARAVCCEAHGQAHETVWQFATRVDVLRLASCALLASPRRAARRL